MPEQEYLSESEIVKEARSSLKWSQSSFGKYLGFSESTIKRWEGGKTNIPGVVLDWCTIVIGIRQIAGKDWASRFKEDDDEQGKSCFTPPMALPEAIKYKGLADVVDRIHEQLLLSELDRERAAQGWK